MSPDHDLTDLLRDAVSDVVPTDRSHELADHPGRRSGRWLAPLAAAAAAVVVVGGLSWIATAHRTPAPPTAATGHRHATAAAPAQGAPVPVSVFYVGATGSGPRLFREQHDVVTSDTGLDAALDEALSGAPLDSDYTPVSTEATTARATIGQDLITVDLSRTLARPSGMSDAAANAAVQALVWTADTQASSTLPVKFTAQGQLVESVLGVDTHAPVDRQAAEQVLSPVSIEQPAEGATVSSGFTVSGQAAAFEGTVQWELRQDGRVVEHGVTTARECCTLSPYQFTVDAPPGRYQLAVRDTDPSGGTDGSGGGAGGGKATTGTTEDTKDLTIR